MGMKVQIRGTGLIGTSLGIALSRKGYAVTLSDPSPTAERLARDLGAGALVTGGGDEPDLIVVAAPPDVAGAVVQCALADHPSSVVTDVASVKGVILTHLIDVGADLSRYVGGHPMAGRERSGAMHARGDLFEGRAWVIVPTDVSRTSATDLVQQIARDAGSVTMVMAASEHDKAVATVSHVPQIVSSLVAAQLRLIDQDAVALAGQGNGILINEPKLCGHQTRHDLRYMRNRGNSLVMLGGCHDHRDRTRVTRDLLHQIRCRRAAHIRWHDDPRASLKKVTSRVHCSGTLTTGHGVPADIPRQIGAHVDQVRQDHALDGRHIGHD